ncbi:hypothetical protein [Geobacillus subterraneus]|uniref:hypothetical protein n=1 Tax=Geobacillus subterraneus TaxID=129338 RepID=UPI0016229B06
MFFVDVKLLGHDRRRLEEIEHSERTGLSKRVEMAVTVLFDSSRRVPAPPKTERINGSGALLDGQGIDKMVGQRWLFGIRWQ